MRLGILEGKEQYDAVRTIRGTEVQISELRILVPGILRGHSRQECEPYSGIYYKPIERRSIGRAADHE